MTADVEHHWVPLDRIKSGSYALISESAQSDTAVVFVHGFLGDASGTWLNFQEMIDSCRMTYPGWAMCDAFFFHYSSFRQSITDSAEELISFVRAVFPNPPGWIFSVPQPFRELRALLVLRLRMRRYKRLVLVGHSEGAVVIRRAVVLEYKRKNGGTPILDAKLALFAPAHLGFTPSGWVGACLATGRVEAIAMMILASSPSFVEMKDKAFLEQIRQDTNAFLQESPDLSGLRARVLFGRGERIVVRGEYTRDFPEMPEPNQDHVSICKPRTGYERPLRFVLELP
ncbi:MAG TPA: hypothetical protein VEJ46_16180 [Candidatus Acidoferrum sp.]|nr:hypothetical protein [Candidatus Acidoferrum sp.]